MLIASLWRERLIICVVAIISTLVAALYAFLSAPIYEARGTVLPPTQSDIANFNYGRTTEAQLNPFSVKDVYGVFLRNLQGESLRRDFFNEVYLSSILGENRKKSEESLYLDFSNALIVTVAGKDNTDRYSVTAKADTADQAAQLVKKYIERASELAQREMINNISSEAGVLARNLHQQIVLFREVGQKEREDSITKLQEAMFVAESIGLVNPSINNGESDMELAGRLDEQPLYMRGTKALKAEIENLSARKSDDPFINRLRTLQARSKFYAELGSEIKNVQVFRMDGEVSSPDRPIQPKKMAILLLGGLFGLMFGVIIALFRIFINSDEQKLETAE